MTFILPFLSRDVNLDNAGGKGANLAHLCRAGLLVPRGFILSTAAYNEFVTINRLDEIIQTTIGGLEASDPAALDAASQRIRTAFSTGLLPMEIKHALLDGYRNLNPEIGYDLPVAVRSSATAEDLPGLSFAGQQDTYLNVSGEEQLLQAVINCWSSLWTARAIGYRMRNSVSHTDVALAVIIQELVASDMSGVLFTANPLTGLLREMVIDATFGLGEALVSGQVEPDHFVVDSLTGEILAKTLGVKQIVTRGKPGGGVENWREDNAGRESLTKEQIEQLVKMGLAIQTEFGAPQDIEWAFVGGQLYLLQTRPITSLFPIPQISFDPIVVWFSFGSVQGLVGPMTTLGQDAIRHVVIGAGKLFGVQIKYEEVDLFTSSGERLWIMISDVIRHPLGNRIFGGLLEYIEPSVRLILRSLAAEVRLGAGGGKVKFSTLRRLAHFALPILVQMVRTMLHPEQARERFDEAIADYLGSAQIPPAADRFKRLANCVRFVRERVANALPFLLPKFIPLFGPSTAALNFLRHISADKSLALDVTRSLPGNVTTQMDLALWVTATVIRRDAVSRGIFAELDATALADDYLLGSLPPISQAAVNQFMDQYGMRGVGEIDFGQPRWREEPTPVMHTLQSYMQIDPDCAPDVLFARGEQAALAAIEKLAAEARRQRGGWIKEKLVRGAAYRIRLLMGARESPKFFAIRTMGIARQALLDVGGEFVQAGTIEHADDLFFLKIAELEDLSQEKDYPTPESTEYTEIQNKFSSVQTVHSSQNWKALVSERRATYQRELRRRQVPRVLVSDGRAFYEGVGADTDTADVITGSPVAPGVVEGVVHVILDPRGARLAPGEILVCPGTDPAWTPLFMVAGGLITEVGGMMTHGSVVAREVGIPAVVGVHQATLRLKDGQRIRLDGTQGKIKVLS